MVRALMTAGAGGALVLAAGPGEGRSTLLRAAGAMGTASGWTVLETRGYADETGFPYAGLQRLIEPLAHLVPDLPPEWAGAPAEIIAGHEPAAGPLGAGLGTLALLRLAAGRRPVLCLVDDADLLDAASWQQIRLAARRLDHVPVVILATVGVDARGQAASADLPVRRLPALDDEAAQELLIRLVPDLIPDAAAGLLDLAAGHPGALADLAAALTPEQRRGFVPPPTALPADSTVRVRGRAALALLPGPTRLLLLLAASDPGATAGELAEAAAVFAETPAVFVETPAVFAGTPSVGRAGPAAFTAAGNAGLAAFGPAENAGLVEVSAAGVRFAPAVLRTVVCAEAPIAQRHAAHRALARVLARRGLRLRALLHRAAVAPGVDESLARELLEAAEGAPAGQAFAAQRHAADLSGDPAVVSRALLAAARSAMAAGRPRDARPLLRRASQVRGSTAVRARARGLIAEMRVRRAPAESRDVLLEVAAELMTADPAGALDAMLLASEACGRTGEPSRYPMLAHRLAGRLRDGSPATEMAVHQMVGLADLMTGQDDAAFGHLGEVLRLAEHSTHPGALVRAASTGILLGRDDQAARLARKGAALARTAGIVPLIPEALEVAAFAELAAGNYDLATEAALDGVAVARGAGLPELADAHLALLGLLAAFVGDSVNGRARMAAATAGHATGGVRALGDWAEALLDLVAGQPGAAAERLGRIARGGGSMALRVAIAPHLVETTGRGGEDFERWAGRTGQPGWLALRSRCRALTGAEGADDHFREALRWHASAGDSGFVRAHTELLYGRHLRRRRRPAEARDHLRWAVATFHRLDALPWAEQASRELRAAGERIGPVGRAPLTAQQERIAGLVAEGATNREVAQQLHLSPRTIDHHLRNVFARLGVRSRTELARLLAG